MGTSLSLSLRPSGTTQGSLGSVLALWHDSCSRLASGPDWQMQWSLPTHGGSWHRGCRRCPAAAVLAVAVCCLWGLSAPGHGKPFFFFKAKLNYKFTQLFPVQIPESPGFTSRVLYLHLFSIMLKTLVSKD